MNSAPVTEKTNRRIRSQDVIEYHLHINGILKEIFTTFIHDQIFTTVVKKITQSNESPGYKFDIKCRSSMTRV